MRDYSIEYHLRNHDLLGALEALEHLDDEGTINHYRDRIYGIYGDYGSQFRVIIGNKLDQADSSESEPGDIDERDAVEEDVIGESGERCFRILSVLRGASESGFVPSDEIVDSLIEFVEQCFNSLFQFLGNELEEEDVSDSTTQVIDPVDLFANLLKEHKSRDEYLLEAIRSGAFLPWLLKRSKHADSHWKKRLADPCLRDFKSPPFNVFLNRLSGSRMSADRHEFVKAIFGILENAEELEFFGLLTLDSELSSYLNTYFSGVDVGDPEMPEIEFIKNVFRCHSGYLGSSHQAFLEVGIESRERFVEAYLAHVFERSLSRAWGHQRAVMVHHLSEVSDFLYQMGFGSLAFFVKLLLDYVQEQYIDLISRFSEIDSTWIRHVDRLSETRDGALYTLVLAAQLQRVESLTREMGTAQPQVFAEFIEKSRAHDEILTEVQALGMLSQIAALEDEPGQANDLKEDYIEKLRDSLPDFTKLPIELRVVTLFRHQEAAHGSLRDLILDLAHPRLLADEEVYSKMFGDDLCELLQSFGDCFVGNVEIDEEWISPCAVYANCVLSPVAQSSSLIEKWEAQQNWPAIRKILFAILQNVWRYRDSTEDYPLLYVCARLIIQFREDEPIPRSEEAIRTLIKRIRLLQSRAYSSIQYFYWRPEDKTIKDGLVAMDAKLNR